MSVHNHTASSTMYTHLLERGKATDSPGISPCYTENSYEGEMREKTSDTLSVYQG